MELLDHLTLQMEKERGLDKTAAIADMLSTLISPRAGQGCGAGIAD